MFRCLHIIGPNHMSLFAPQICWLFHPLIRANPSRLAAKKSITSKQGFDVFFVEISVRKRSLIIRLLDCVTSLSVIVNKGFMRKMQTLNGSCEVMREHNKFNWTIIRRSRAKVNLLLSSGSRKIIFKKSFSVVAHSRSHEVSEPRYMREMTNAIIRFVLLVREQRFQRPKLKSFTYQWLIFTILEAERKFAKHLLHQTKHRIYMKEFLGLAFFTSYAGCPTVLCSLSRFKTFSPICWRHCGNLTILRTLGTYFVIYLLFL